MLSDVQEQDEGLLFLRRIAEGRYSSPLLLVGDEGIGRRFAIIQLVKELFCAGSRDHSCSCYHCVQIDSGNHESFTTLSPVDDKDIGIDPIRGVIEDVGSFPAAVPYKVFLIDGADRMTGAAANAFLKTLEEPPPYARFFLLAERPENVIGTIRSRCGLVRFRSLSEALILSRLQRFESDSTKALVYARMGEGSVGRALSYWGAGRLRLRDTSVTLLNAGVRRDLPSIFSIVASLDKDLPLALRFMEQLLYDLLMIKQDPTRMVNIDIVEVLQAMRTQISDSTHTKLSTGLKTLNRRRTIPIYLPFHVQTLFAEAFIGA